MNVQVVKQPNSQVTLEIEVDSAAIGHAIDRSYQRLSQRVNVPGFRKGKAPRAVLEAKVGRSAMLEEAADIAVNDAYQWALDHTGLTPISSPEVSLQSKGLDPSQPLFFTATFYVQPTVYLGDYASIRVEPVKRTVTDEDVERMITRLAEQSAPWEPVEDRPAQGGDMAFITIKGTVDDETVVEQDEEEYYLDPLGVSDTNALDLTPHIIGMAVDETRDFDLVLTDSFRPAQYAGKTMACHVALRRLERKATPIIDDAFAQSVGDYETVNALRAFVHTSLESEQRVNDTEAFVTDVARRAIDEASVEIPPPLVEDEIHRTLGDLKDTVEGRRQMTFDLYLRVLGKTEEDLHEEARGPATLRVKSNLVMEAIADAEGLVPDRREVEAELQKLAALPTVRERDRRRILASATVRARIETRIKRRQALQRLLEIANPIPTPNLADDSADKDSSDGTIDQRTLQEAARSHADALESAPYQPGEEEI